MNTKKRWIGGIFLAILVIAGFYFGGFYLDKKEKADYISGRQNWCKDTFESQLRRQIGAVDYKYVSLSDQCQVFYKDSNPPTPQECQDNFRIHSSQAYGTNVYTGEPMFSSSMHERAQLDFDLCVDGLSVRIF